MCNYFLLFINKVQEKYFKQKYCMMYYIVYSKKNIKSIAQKFSYDM